MNPTKTVNANLTFSVDGHETSRTKTLSVTVPADQEWPQWVQGLEDLAEPILRRKGAENGMLSYRLDGTSAPLTIWQRIADIWHHWTWRGTPYTGSRFIPVWPEPAGR